MKTVVYTCITGKYDTLRNFNNPRDPNVDFVCFTDNPMLQYDDKGWLIRPIPKDLCEFSTVKQQRLVKILPHRYLGEYDVSVWIDGNITVLCDVRQFLKTLDLTEHHFFTRHHPSRKCLYEEAEKVISFGKDIRTNVDSQISRYRNEGFPKDFGLAETCVIIRKHNEKDCQILDNMWAKEIINGSHRDQLSLDYCRWKSKMEIGYFTLQRMTTDKNFKWSKHG